ncbi:competence protein CoiA family protein [Roseivirga sp. 4D4]|uniref:competence protein CoiA family protein n=1 Tax=Roseivirga sp. 4D4 TaxID=1889784 RepID=UPI000AB60B0C|nr:competence protein CoiA family protein [Roseivirga sp. 4D4]
MALKIPYALKDDLLVCIEVVESGLSCGCTCPACGASLVARKGRQKVHHFAHHNAPECKYALETTLHLLAKEILATEKQIKLPAIRYKGIYLRPPQVIRFQEVYVEKKLHDIIPDLYIMIKNKMLLIEIAVTHFVDDLKKLKIEEIGVSAVEIDLSQVDRESVFDELKDTLTDSTLYKYWIHNTRIPELYEKHLEKEEAKQKAYDEEIKRLNKEAVVERRKERQQKRQREKFYEDYYKKITVRKSERTFYGKVSTVDNCLLDKRDFHGVSYANVHADCFHCEHFRGFKKEKEFIVCLAPYNLEKTRHS